MNCSGGGGRGSRALIDSSLPLEKGGNNTKRTCGGMLANLGFTRFIYWFYVPGFCWFYLALIAFLASWTLTNASYLDLLALPQVRRREGNASIALLVVNALYDEEPKRFFCMHRVRNHSSLTTTTNNGGIINPLLHFRPVPIRNFEIRGTRPGVQCREFDRSLG